VSPDDVFGPLQVLPQGLLGFLNIKNNGLNPEWLRNSVQPVLDLQQWWFNTQASDLGSGATVLVADNGTGFNSFTTPQVAVPNGEFWFVTDCTIRTGALAATDACSFSVGYILPPSPFTTFQLGVRTSASGAAGVASQGIASARMFWLPPGAVLAVANETNESAGAGITYTLNIRGSRLRI
jgi:hypothetical protein